VDGRQLTQREITLNNLRNCLFSHRNHHVSNECLGATWIGGPPKLSAIA
jgi:hypothetical protein